MKRLAVLALIILLFTALVHIGGRTQCTTQEPFLGMGAGKSSGGDSATSASNSLQWSNPWTDVCTGQDAGWDTKQYGDKKVTLQKCIKEPGTDGCDSFQVVVGNDNKITVKDCPKDGCPDSEPGKPGCTPIELTRDDSCKDPRTALVFTSCANKQSWDDNLAVPVGDMKAIADDQSMRDMLLKANQAQAMTLRQMMMVEVPQSFNGYEISMGMMGGALSSSEQLGSMINSADSSASSPKSAEKKPAATKTKKPGSLF